MQFSKDTKLGVLLANEKTKEVLIRHFTEALLTHPMLNFAKGMSLSKVAALSGEIPQEVLDACDEDLRKL